MATVDKELFIEDVQDRIEEYIPAKQSRKVVSDIRDVMVGYDVQQIAVDDTDNSDTAELIRQFLEAKKSEGRSEQTIEHYRYVLERLYEGTKVPLRKMTDYHLKLFYASERARGISMVTIKGNNVVHRSFYSWMQLNGYIHVNPTASIGSIKATSEQEEPFSDLELYEIRQALKNKREIAVVYFLMATGCRVSELCGANRDDVDWIGLKLDVIGKGNKKRRVYLDPVSAAVIKDYLSTRTDNEPALFLSRTKERFEPGGIRAMLKRIEKRSGVPNIHPHRFRHTFATSLVDRGMDIQEVSTILGHAKLDTTMIYVTVNQRNVENSYRRYAYI